MQKIPSSFVAPEASDHLRTEDLVWVGFVAARLPTESEFENLLGGAKTKVPEGLPEFSEKLLGRKTLFVFSLIEGGQLDSVKNADRSPDFTLSGFRKVSDGDGFPLDMLRYDFSPVGYSESMRTRKRRPPELTT